MYTVSTYLPSDVAKRNFIVPSLLRVVSTGEEQPTQNEESNISLFAFEMLVISLISCACFTYIHCAICLAVNLGMESCRHMSCNSFIVIPNNGVLFICHVLGIWLCLFLLAIFSRADCRIGSNACRHNGLPCEERVVLHGLIHFASHFCDDSFILWSIEHFFDPCCDANHEVFFCAACGDGRCAKTES